MRALDALDRRLEVLRWWRSPEGQTAAHALAPDPIMPDDQKLIENRHMTLSTRLRVSKQGELYYVAASIGDVLAEASEQLPEFELYESLIPCPEGIVFFEQPLHMATFSEYETDVGMFPAQAHLMGMDWAVCILVQGDEPSWALQMASYCLISLPTIPALAHRRVLHCGAILSLVMGDALGGNKETRMSKSVTTYERGNSPMDFTSQLLGALFLFVEQRIVTSAPCKPKRADHRRAAKMGIPAKDVLVVQLRKTEQRHTNQEGDPVDWSHRWMVSGHWRQQWYPSAGVNRPKWIAPYIKGPEDKPLVTRVDRIGAVVR